MECDICLVATVQRPNSSYNKGYIALWPVCACEKLAKYKISNSPYFQYRFKIWRHHRVPGSRFSIRRGNFGDSAINKGYIAYSLLRMLETAIFPLPIGGRFQLFFHRKSKYPPYFYFRFILPTELESVPRVEPPTLIISIKFEVDTTTHRRVTAFLVRIRHVTLRAWPLTFYPWTVVKHGRSCG